MKTKQRLSFYTILVAILLVMSTSQAQESLNLNKPEPAQLKVKLVILADKNIENKIKSYLSRELRSLGDVSIVDEHPDREIRIVALELKDSEGYKRGVSMSVLTLKPFHLWKCGGLFGEYNARRKQVKQNLHAEKGREPSESEMKEGMSALTKLTKVYSQRMDEIYSRCISDVYRIASHALHKGSNLRDQCSSIIANFDAEHLEAIRKAHPMFRYMVQ